MTFKYKSFDTFIQSLSSSTFEEIDYFFKYLHERFTHTIHRECFVMPLLNSINRMGFSDYDTVVVFYFITAFSNSRPLDSFELKHIIKLITSINRKKPIIPEKANHLWACTTLIDAIGSKNSIIYTDFISFLLSPIKSGFDFPEAFSRYNEETTYYEFLNNEPSYVSFYFSEFFTTLQQAYFKLKIDNLNRDDKKYDAKLKKLTENYYDSFQHSHKLMTNTIQRYCRATGGNIDIEGLCTGLTLNYLINKQLNKSNNAVIKLLSLKNLTEKEMNNLPTQDKKIIDEFIHNLAPISDPMMCSSTSHQKYNKLFFLQKSPEYLEKYSGCTINFITASDQEGYILLKAMNGYILKNYHTRDIVIFASLEEMADHITTIEGRIAIFEPRNYSPILLINERTDAMDLDITASIFISKPKISDLEIALISAPENEMLFLTFMHHETGLIKQDGIYYYYDANSYSREHRFSDVASLSTFILSTTEQMKNKIKHPLPYKDEKIPYHIYSSSFNTSLQLDDNDRVDIHILITSNYPKKISEMIKTKTLYWNTHEFEKYLKFLLKNNNVTQVENILKHSLDMLSDSGINNHTQSEITQFMGKTIITLSESYLSKTNEQVKISIKNLINKYKKELDVPRVLDQFREKISNDPEDQDAQNLIAIANFIEDTISVEFAEFVEFQSINETRPILFQRVTENVETALKEDAEQNGIDLYKERFLHELYRKALKDPSLKYIEGNKIVVSYKTFCEKANKQGYIDSLSVDLAKSSDQKTHIKTIRGWATTHNKVKNDIEKKFCYSTISEEYKRLLALK